MIMELRTRRPKGVIGMSQETKIRETKLGKGRQRLLRGNEPRHYLAEVTKSEAEARWELGGWRDTNKFYASQGSKDQESKAVKVLGS